MIRVDNQPIESRFGDSIWITDLITPDNPSISLLHKQLTNNQMTQENRIRNLWGYVSNLPYKQTVQSRLVAGGKVFKQNDTWFYPSETISIKESNCANKSFLLTSLLKKDYSNLGEIYCVMGFLHLGEIGAHAWVEMNRGDERYIIETTQPSLKRILIPADAAGAYEPLVYFDESSVYTSGRSVNINQTLSAPFGICAVPFLADYICRDCLSL